MLGKAISTVAIKSIHILISIITSIALTRFFGPTNFGIYVFVMASAQILGFLIRLGFPTLIIRNVARYKVESQFSETKGLLIRSRQFVLSSSLIILIILTAVHHLYSPSNSLVYLSAAAMITIEVQLVLMAVLLMAYENVILSQSISQVLRPILFLLLILICNHYKLHNAPETGFIAHIVSCIVIIPFMAILVKKLIPREVFSSTPVYNTKKWLKSACHFALMNGVWMLFGQTDIIMLGILGNNEDAGFYRIATFASSFVLFVSHGINDLYKPKIASLYKKESQLELQKIVHNSARLIFGIGLLISTIIILFAEPAVEFAYGPEYRSVVEPMIVLCAGYSLLGAMGSITVLLPMLGDEKLALKTQLLALLTNIILNYLLIPVAGISGAAVATIISFFIWYFVQFSLLYRKKRIRSFVV